MDDIAQGKEVNLLKLLTSKELERMSADCNSILQFLCNLKRDILIKWTNLRVQVGLIFTCKYFYVKSADRRSTTSSQV